jgi:hypothetical protein
MPTDPPLGLIYNLAFCNDSLLVLFRITDKDAYFSVDYFNSNFADLLDVQFLLDYQ